MSNTDFTSDIDAILAEFSSFSSTFSSAEEATEEVATAAEAIVDVFSGLEDYAVEEPVQEIIEEAVPLEEPAYSDPEYSEPAEPVYSQPVYTEPAPIVPQPVFSQEVFTLEPEPVIPVISEEPAAAVQPAEPEIEKTEVEEPKVRRRAEPAKPAPVDFDPEMLGMKTGKRKTKEEKKAEKKAKKEKAPKEPKPPKAPKVKPEPKPEPLAVKALKNLIGMICAVLSVFVLCWVVLNVHPDSGTSTSPAGKSTLDLVGDLDVYVNNAASDALGDLAYIKKIYTLNESDTVAPMPDASKFGSTTDPAVIQQVIDSAASLLEGQELAWDPNVDFFPGSEIKYYCDDTILVIAWKELIEGKCCTCAEVKIAHGSQLRRKLADNTYGSSVQLKATEMATEVNSVIAINGDFYAFRDLGITAYQRQLYRCNPAQVDSCFFTASGDMLFSYAGELMDAGSAQQFIDDNDVTFAIAFGPVLVDNGQLRQIDSYPIGEIHRTYSRASIGMLDELHYFLMTINYEGDCTVTSTINQSAQFMYDKGCQKAYALDGGQTSVMVMQGQTVNKVDWGSERIMSDIIYFATAIPEQEVAK